MKHPPHKLLIIDDEPNIRLLYEKEFADDGYDVATAGSAPEGLELIGRFKPNLVILDIKMPGMDGIEALGKIVGSHKNIPVIINSAYSHYQENFMSWSADAYIIKSPDLTELKNKVKHLLEKTTE